MISKNQLKYIQSLGQKKPRDAENKFVAEGPKVVDELLAAKNCSVSQVLAVKEWIRQRPEAGQHADITEITEDELKRISQLATPNQVLAIAEKISWVDEPVIKERISLVLDSIQDPGNLGTIIRTADWFGIATVFCSTDCADIYNPKVIQSTMGSITRVRVEYRDLSPWLTENSDTRSYAAVLDGRDVTKMEKLTEGIIVIGNESKGISKEIMGLVNVRVTIPGNGRAESLNAAVATGIILSHLL